MGCNATTFVVIVNGVGGFSTLYGSKWVATTPALIHAALTSQVSVPSTGRSGLQHYDSLLIKPCHKVSVPSTGRSGLQPRFIPGVGTVYWRFSTLYGSKWVATTLLMVTFREGLKFQYPLRVEVDCNE